MKKRLACLAVAASAALAAAHAETVTTTAADGVVVYGETYYGALAETAPLIALFHQARSNGRGEYGPLTDWLNALGFRVIAWDQRSGGALHGSENRTAKAAKGKKGFCDAYPDIEAGFAFSKEAANAAPLIVWGSSYSAALVIRLAAEQGEAIDALVAASPAQGAVKACLPRDASTRATAPALVIFPRSEAKSVGANETITIGANRTEIVENGVHGSSALVDARTDHDMSADRTRVAAWLADIVRDQE